MTTLSSLLAVLHSVPKTKLDIKSLFAESENTNVESDDRPTYVLAKGFGSLVSGVSGRRRIRFLDGKRKS